jgi:hypothetical protein
MTKEQIADIFENRIHPLAKWRLQKREEMRKHFAEQSKELEKQKKEIREYLIAGICPDCGGDIKERASFNPMLWCIDLWLPVSHKMCICKHCGAKKGIIYFYL